ncbi:hypothetical protein [Shewanella halotolerans]|uniref:hypothetical protein n=1 Tax=Shewanella halotolerans TaxID=2864204 RepID=UPI001C65D0E3|nr:hypothetical protein [Shewanella halotolerans]QYJ89460.1 hypothetical protein K0H81_17070 [Shewanella halotolerans]
MSSPLGGFYLAAQQRRMQALQRQRDTPKCRLNLTLTCDDRPLIAQCLTLEPGVSELSNQTVSIQLCSSFTPTGLLKVVSDIYLCTADEPRHIGTQELYLSPNEPVTSLVAGNCHYRLTLMASQLAQDNTKQNRLESS